MYKTAFPRYNPDGTGDGESIVLDLAAVRIDFLDGDSFQGLVISSGREGLFVRGANVSEETFIPWTAVKCVKALDRVKE